MIVPWASRIDCTDTLRTGFSDDLAPVASPEAEASVAATDGAVGDGGDFHTFWAAFFCASAGGGAGCASPICGTGRGGPEVRRAHSQAPNAPIATPHSTPTIVDQLEVGAAAPEATTVSAGARVAGVLAVSPLGTNVALAVAGALAALSVAEPAVSTTMGRGTLVPAGGCAHAAGLPLSSPSSRRSTNGRLPTGGQPASWGRLIKPGGLVERLRVMKHLG